MLHVLGILAGILAIIAAIPYIKDIFRGTTRPNRVTWLIWVTLQTIALIAQIVSGGKDSLLLTIGDLVASATILILSFTKGETEWHWIDRWALAGAGLGLLLWYFFRQPIWALAMTVFVDFCGVVPTLRKGFVNPESETLTTWLIVGAGAVLGTISVGSLNITLLLYPIYLAVANLGVAVAILLGRLRNKPNY